MISLLARIDLKEAPHTPARRRGPIRRFFGSAAPPFSSPLTSAAPCDLCRATRQAERWALEDFLAGLTENERGFSDLYGSSGGLCFPHLRDARSEIDPDGFGLAKLLVRHAQLKLAKLQARISEYLRKHSWQFRDEAMTREERSSGKKAIVFFAGDPGGEIPWKIPEESQRRLGHEVEGFRENRKAKGERT